MRDYQKVYPVGRIYLNNHKYFLLRDKPEHVSTEDFCPINGFIWSVVEIDDNTVGTIKMEVDGVKQDVWLYPSPFLITSNMPFLIEWDAPQFILCRPTGAQPSQGDE